MKYVLNENKEVVRIFERDFDGTGPEGKGPRTGKKRGRCSEEQDYDTFFEGALKKFAKKFGIKADIQAFSKEQKKELFDYVDKNWKAEKETD